MRTATKTVIIALLFGAVFLGGSTSTSAWQNVEIEQLGTPPDKYNGGNLQCEYQDLKSLYVRSYQIINNSLIPEEQYEEVEGKTYTDVCVVQNDNGVIGQGIWAQSGSLDQALPITSSIYTMMPSPGGSASLFFGVAPGGLGGLQISINHNLQYIGNLQTRTFGSGISAIDEKIWAIDASKIDEFLSYSDGQTVAFESFGFSENGRYLVAKLKSSKLVRIDLYTKQLLVISDTTQTAPYMTISNDGNNAVFSGGIGFRAFNLNGCGSIYEYGEWPLGLPSTDNCASNDLYSVLAPDYPGIELMHALRYRPNSRQLEVIVLQKPEGTWIRNKILLTDTDAVSTASGYIAMGDSFASGEGDTEGGEWYESGTDEQGNINTFAGRNLCHLSRRSYPYLIALEFGYLANNQSSPSIDEQFHSVACSGAKIHNITGLIGEKQDDGTSSDFSITDNQYRFDDTISIGVWQPGAEKQKGYLQNREFGELVRQNFNPEIITIGVGGNDAGFAEKLTACMQPGICEYVTDDDAKTRLIIEMAGQKPRLISTYKDLKNSAPDARIYVVGYPQFVNYPVVACGNNVALHEDEVEFVYRATNYFNQVVASAASEAGVVYVDVEEMLSNANLCSGANDTEMAVNGVTSGNDTRVVLAEYLSLGVCKIRSGCFGKESFHPNSKAHEKYAETIKRLTENLTTPNPEPVDFLLPEPDEYFGFAASGVVASMNDENFVFSGPSLSEFIADMPSYHRVGIESVGWLQGTEVEVEIHSDPVSLGTFAVDQDGKVDTEVDLPIDISAGYHELHIKGYDSFGNKVSYYEPIIVSASVEDFDGDGVLNSVDTCQTVRDSGVDADQDGIDDVCDPEIGVIKPEDPTKLFCEEIVVTTNFKGNVTLMGNWKNKKELKENPGVGRPMSQYFYCLAYLDDLS